MSTQEPDLPYGGSTGERLKSFALSEDARERVSLLATRYWEVASYAVLLVSAAILRFYNLGARALHHDESLHAYFSYGFTRGLRDVFIGSNAGGEYVHEPFMHGPFQFIGNGFVMYFTGDGDYQARILAALMGTAMVGMPLLLRKQLGVFGALAAAAFIAFSPTLMYYSRFTREDIYTGFWTLGIVIFMWRYLTSGNNRELYLTAFFMAGAFCTKETTFMTVAAFVLFLNYMFAVHIADHLRRKREMSVIEYGVIVALLNFVAWAIAIAWPFIENWRAKYDLDEFPVVGSLLVVMATLAIPNYAATIQFLPSFLGFGKEWQDRSYGNGNYNVHPDEARVAYSTIVFLLGASATVGLLWRPKTWLIAAACFWIPFILLYTTFFTNLPGFWSGTWGSWDDWNSQQEEARGNQPIYYYFITIPVYEFLPLALAIAGAFYYAIRGNMQRALFVGAGLLTIIICLVLPPGPEVLKASLLHVFVPFAIVLIGVMTLPMKMFDRFLIFWVVFTTFALTVASEKMPWLNVHIAVGLCLLAGRFVGQMLESSDLRADLPKLERLAPFFYAAAASALSILVFVIVGPFELASVGAYLLAIVAAVAVYWAWSGYSQRTAIQVALAGLIAAFSIFSLRAGVLASWGHPDSPWVSDPGDPNHATRDYGVVPDELLVYTQTSGDIPKIRDRIAQIARESGLGAQLPIAVDTNSGFSWPWAWYLRDPYYKNVTWADFGANWQPTQPGQIVISHSSNASSINLGDGYEPGITIHHRRWFPEEYRNGSNGAYTTHDFFRDVVSRDMLHKWLDFWVRRTLPASEPGTEDAVVFFPKGTAGVPTVPAGPTVRADGAQLVIGGSGTALGQLQEPADVAVDAQGNIYVADDKSNRINKYDANGVFQKQIAGFGGEPKGLQFNQPYSIAVAPDGTIFVADSWNHRIVRLGSDLQQQKEWGSGGQVTADDDDPMKLYAPRDIAIAPDGHVLITDTGNSRIIEYTADGEFVRQFGSRGDDATTDETPDKLNEPVGLAISSSGDIYVADYWNKRVLVFDREFNNKQLIQVPGWGSQAVTDRGYIALLPDGRLLATVQRYEGEGTTNPISGQVLVFDTAGQQVAAYDMPVEGDKPYSRPVGIATDGTSVLVSDSNGAVVRKIPLSEVAP
jgi:predicted membrane-bound mannosyltransferase/sugar lactone lactonase YvrE